MRHFYIKQILLTIAVLLFSLTANAYGFEVDGIKYYILSEENLTVEVSGKTENSGGNIVIPSVVNYGGNEYSVTSIGFQAFDYCSSLTSIEIPNSVTYIEEQAFKGCTSLTNVTFGENSQLTEIGYSAFEGCSSLTNIEIPNPVTYIGYTAFKGCTSLTNVTFGENSQLTEIGYYAFKDCTSLTSIEIPNSVITIGFSKENWYPGGAFEGCTSLTSVTFGENSQLTTIYGGFIGCTSLTSIEIPNTVTAIGNTFKDCTSLTSVIFGENSQLNTISGSFSGCTSLTSIEIPNSVTVIEEGSLSADEIFGAFEGCTSLTSVTFGENSQLTEIGYNAFKDCTSLTSIEIPNSVISIVRYVNSGLGANCGAFEGCTSLTSVIFEENSQLTILGYDAFKDCTSLTSIEIPNSVITIGCCVFENCSSLASVTFGENSQLEKICYSAFEGCTSLTSIAIPNSVTYIKEEAFGSCTSLKELIIKDGYTTLELEEDCSFSDCPLETIYLGRNLSFDSYGNSPFKNIKTLKTLTVGADVTEILGKTFYDCSNLESIYMKGVPPIITDNTFSNASYYNATVYVPQGTLAFYQSANVWKNFWNIQEYEPASIEDTDANTLDFIITSNGISLLNADNSAVAIYSINGILVEKIDKYTGEEIVLNKGVYIVCVGDKTVKIKL